MRKKQLFLGGIMYLYLVAGALLIIFPIYITVVTAFKSPAESTKSFFTLPSSWYLDNFKQVVSDAKFLTYSKNSILITAVAVSLIAVFVPMVSYSISRNLKRKYYCFLYGYFVMGIFVPFQVLMIPLAKLSNNLNLMNQYGLIIIYVTLALIQGVFLFVAYFKSVPMELDEAAEVDGCSVWRTFTTVIFPVVKPMTATIIILNTLWIWNDFLLPILILNKSSDFWTLPLFQYNFKSSYTFDFSLAFASFLFSIVPMLILYVFLQRYIVEGLTAGAVKA